MSLLSKREIFILLVTFLFITGVLDTAIFAQKPEEPAQVETAAEEGELSVEGAEPSVTPGNVTMDFKNAEISNVLRILSLKSSVNIVAGPEVTGLVTIRLTDVPWEKALDVVLRTYGFTYEREGNIIRVTTIESLKQEELTTEVYSLKYAKAQEVVESIKEMLTERGKIKYDERTNVVVATDIPTNLYRIRQVIDKLDRRTPQVLIEAKIIEVRLDDSEYLGIDWNTEITVEGAAKPTTLPFTRRTETALERGTDKFFPVGLAAQFPAGEIDERSIFPFVDLDSETLQHRFEFGVLDFTQFQAVLRFLQQRTDTDILSNPRITTLNNKESVIHVGETMLFPTFERNDDTGQLEISGFTDERQLGVKLTVTPHINTEGDIVVKLKPEVSSFDRVQTLDASRGIVAPVFDIREAEAEVMIRDGDTIMLGGLITKTVENTKNKIPFLGDIPLIGDYLFSRNDKTVDRAELIIFLTVYLVKDKWETHLDPNIVHVGMPVVRDSEIVQAIPKVKKEKKKWWKFWQ